MTESTLSPERVLILIDCRGAARAAVCRGAWKAFAPARAPTISAATRRIVAFFFYRLLASSGTFDDNACVPRSVLTGPRCAIAELVRQLNSMRALFIRPSEAVSSPKTRSRTR